MAKGQKRDPKTGRLVVDKGLSEFFGFRVNAETAKKLRKKPNTAGFIREAVIEKLKREET